MSSSRARHDAQPFRFGWPTLLSLFAIVASPVSLLAQAQNDQKVPSVVAAVNAERITHKALAESSLERYGRDELDRIVNQHLILQACQKQGIVVTEDEVNAEVNRIAEKFGLSLDSYLTLLQEERDISPNQYSREIIWPMLALRRLVADKIIVTDEEYNQAFLSQYGEAVKCRLIMKRRHADAVKLQGEAKANPASFGDLAKQFSEDEASASVGGLIPPIRRHTSDSRLEEVAFALQPNEVSDLLQLGDQWVFLQGVRRINGDKPSPQALPAIKEQITDRIRDGKMRSAASELFANLQRDAKVVKVLGNPALRQQYPGAAAIVNGQQLPIAHVARECVRKFGETVLEGEINRKLLSQALRAAKKRVTDADIQTEIAKAATSYGFVRSNNAPDVEAWIESVTSNGRTTKEIYIADTVWPSVALTKLVEDDIKITPADLQAGFESAYGPKVEVLAIVLGDQRSAQKVWELARDNPTDLFFGKLAEQYSIEPVSASNSGKVPPIRKHGGQPAVEKEAFRLKPGQLSGIIATGGKYILLRCQGMTEPVVSDPSSVQEELLAHLKEKKLRLAMADKFDALVENAEIDNFFKVAKKSKRVAQR